MTWNYPTRSDLKRRRRQIWWRHHRGHVLLAIVAGILVGGFVVAAVR